MKHADLISRMTLAEKCAILNGATNWETKSIPRLKIPSLFLADGPVGVRKQEGPSDHLGLNASLPATCFPSPATLANSWDEALVERVGTAMGKEARALGVDILLGPGLNLKRNPLCGRSFEYYSEDPCLAGKLAAAAIRGLQRSGVGACAKHFAVNSQEHLRMHSDSVLDERTLHEMYLTAFEIAVREGKPKAVMSAYNRVNGVYANDSKALLQDTLRDEWGFDGIVVTDWGASNERVAGLVAGNHLEMPGSTGISDLELMDAVQAGELDEKLLNTRVDELLQVILPLAERQKDEAAFDTEAHHAIAREAAAQSIVLLKNDGDILPLCTGEKVVVIGDLAGTPRYQGSGSSAVNAAKVDIPLDLLRQSGLDVAGYAPGYRRDGTADNGLLTTAVELAKQAHTVILYMGLTESYESEGMDRPHICYCSLHGSGLYREPIAA